MSKAHKTAQFLKALMMGYRYKTDTGHLITVYTDGNNLLRLIAIAFEMETKREVLLPYNMSVDGFMNMAQKIPEDTFANICSFIAMNTKR